MRRFVLALALVSQLSGLAGVAAVVCRVQEARAHPCCCERDDANGGALPARAPVATEKCPCTMAPAVPSPVKQTPATAASRVEAGTPAIVPAAWRPDVPGRSCDEVAGRPHVDVSPPLISASQLRC